ncbi:hypothetical protein BegalDRAFT_1021 [Beggiatoa alba B18LD]|uniref:Uncharacterized protein n=1 Tax=Beggiatoa alba B18LD TaxID=395493 RepID=I3CE82_9GAMM|nr:hypothetical protein BegalDRAFT_1021 [Beggiatoa alba B18LD]
MDIIFLFLISMLYLSTHGLIYLCQRLGGGV